MAKTIFFLIVIKLIVSVSADDLNMNNVMMGAYENVFDQNLYKRIVDPIKCERQMELLLNNISMSFPFIDASGKFPSGLLLGNHMELGSYYQCLNIQNSAYDMDIEGKYCMMQMTVTKDIFKSAAASLSFVRLFGNSIMENKRLMNIKQQVSVLSGFGHSLISRYEDNITTDNTTATSNKTTSNNTDSEESTIKLSWGICIPKVCQPRDVFKYILSQKPNLVNNFTFNDELFCRVPNDKPYSIADYIAILVFSFLALITVASTSYDLYHVFVLHSEKCQINIFYRSFSIYTNTKRLLTINTVPGALECVEGVRAISMLWVIVGHTYSTTMLTSVYNMSDVLKWLTSFSSTWINSAPLAVDTFFTLSGILCVYSVIGKISRSMYLFSPLTQ